MYRVVGEQAKELWDKGFGEYDYDTRTLVLSPFEIVYITEKKLGSLPFSLSQEELTKSYPTFSRDYRVYADLVDKGYVVCPPLHPDETFRVYAKGLRRGEGATTYVIVVIDASSFSFTHLTQVLSLGQRVRKDVVLAIVSGNDILYLKVSKTTF